MALGGFQRLWAPAWVSGPDRPPLISPVVEASAPLVGVGPGALELGCFLAGEPALGVRLAGEAAAVPLAVRSPVDRTPGFGSIWAMFDGGHRSCGPTFGRAWHRVGLDAAGGDQGV